MRGFHFNVLFNKKPEDVSIFHKTDSFLTLFHMAIYRNLFKCPKSAKWHKGNIKYEKMAQIANRTEPN